MKSDTGVVRGSEVILQAKEFIIANCDNRLTIARVANAVGESNTYRFYRFFRETEKMEFAEFVNRARVERSKSLLLNPHYTATEIALELGFKSLTQFREVFKRLLGESPTEYRKRVSNMRDLLETL